MPRFSINANGAIVTIGNNLMTCPATDANCAAAKIGKAPNNNNNAFDMINLDADNEPTTFNSSMSSLSLPTGAKVEWAGLYWGARLNAGVNGVAGTGNMAQMSLKAPGAASYQTIAADPTPSSQFGPYSAGANAYQRMADVTAIVAAAGSGDYWGANVVGGTGQDRYAGWSLVVVYEAPGLPLRNLTVFDGFTNVGASSPQTITVSGFQAPLTGPVDATLTMVAYEGDMTQTGDFTKLNGAQLATATSPGSNFFNSTNDWLGASVTTRNPADKNMLGFDIKDVGASGIIGNDDTSATFTFGSTGDAYYPGVLTTAINLYAPDFTASSKTAVDLSGNSPAQPGDIIAYNVNYVNSGQDPATGLVSTDPLPDGVAYVPGSLTLGVPGFATPLPLTDAALDDQGEFDSATNSVVVRIGNGASPTSGGALNPGGMESYQFQVQVLPDAAGLSLTNIAHLAYTTGTTRISATYDTTPATTDVQQQADVAVTKSLSPSPVAAGAPLTATMTVTNHGPNLATGVQLSDPLDGWLNPIVDASGAPGAACSLTGGLSCSLPDMADGAMATVLVTGNLPTDATQLTATNVARASSETYDPDLANNVASATVALTQAADLSATKSIVSTSMTPGSQVSYKVTVTNNGPSDAAGVVLSDVVPPSSTAVLTVQGATSSDMTCAGASCTLATLTAGASAAVTVNAQLSPSMTGAFTNTATVTAATPDPDPTNNTATATDTASDPSADVRLTKTANPSPVVAGSTITYTLAATNYGPSDATNVVVTDVVPASVQIPDDSHVTTNRGSCSINGQTVTCTIGTLPASLAPGAAGATANITIWGKVTSDTTGQVVNTATVATGSTDPDSSNNTATTTTPVDYSADVWVTKTADATQAPVGAAAVNYTITVGNDGPSMAQNVTLSDAIPASVAPGTVALPAGVTCDTAPAAGATWTCHLGSIDAGRTVVITLPTTVTSTGADIAQTATVTASTTDPNTANNTATWTLTTAPQADLSIAKSVPELVAGDWDTYTLTVANNRGDASVPTVTDTLPAGLTPQPSGTANSDTSPECGIDSANPQLVTCTTTALSQGSSHDFLITVKVADLPDGTPITNTATVSGSLPDPSMVNNTATVTTPVFTVADMETTAITWNQFSPTGGLAAGPGPATPVALNSSFVWLTMTFTNNGPSTAQNASFAIDYDMNLTNIANAGAPYVFWNWGAGNTLSTTDPDCHIVQTEIVCPLQNGSGGTSIAPKQSVTVSLLVGIRGDSPNAGYGTDSVTTTTFESNYGNNPGKAPLSVRAGLTHPLVTKTAAPGPGPVGALVAGGTFSYTMQVYQQQDGTLLPQGYFWAPAPGVTLHDPLPGGFHATNATTSQGSCTISSATTPGDTVDCNLDTVAGTFLLNSGQSGPAVTVTISGTIDANATPGATTNKATVDTTSTNSLGPSSGTATVNVVQQADLRLLKYADHGLRLTPNALPTYYAGGNVGYTLVASNAGPSATGTSTVTDTLPLGLTLDAANSPGCTIATPGDVATDTPEVVTCPVNPLAANQSQVLRVVANTSPLDTRLPGTGPGCVPGAPQYPWDPTGPVNPAGCDQYPAHPRQIDNTAIITADGTSATAPTDPDLTNNTATASAMLDTQADIAITATPSTTTPAAGDTVTYTAVSINNGPSVGDFPLGDVTFPPGFVPISWDVPGNVCTLSHDTATPPVYTLSCQAIPAAPLFLIFLPGQAVTSMITVQIPPDTPAGTYRATGHTYSQTLDPNPANNWVFVDVQVRQVSNLALTKTLVSPLVAGQLATYKLSVTNAGPSVANDIVVSDTVPVGLKFSSARDPRGAPCPTPQTENGDTVLLCGAGTLAVGATTSVTVTFQVDDNSTPSLCNMGLVGSLSYDPVADNNQSTACAAVTEAAPGPVPSPSTPDLTAPTGGSVSGPPSAWWLVVLAAGLLVGGLARWHRRLADA